MNSFTAYYSSLVETLSSYEYVKQVICDFNGDGKASFPLFYKCVSGEEIVFPRLSRRCSVLLGFEVANYVIDHLTGDANINNIEGTPAKDLNEKQKNIVTYLSGYVFGTLYRRIRRPKNQSDSTDQYLSLLLSCKSTSSEIREDEKLVDARNSGGLWRVKPEVGCIFEVAEKHFRTEIVDRSSKNIDSKGIVSTLMKNCVVLSNFTKSRNMSSEKTSKEIALNLLEDLLTLFIRTRTFCYQTKTRIIQA